MKRSANTKPGTKRPKLRPEIRELARLYEADETAWLEQTSALMKKRDYDRIDYKHLAEYLDDMAKRDRREVLSRLATLLAHLLKRNHQPSMQTPSWENTIRLQRHELQAICESKTLRNYAQEVMPKAYARARNEAIAETALPESRFPAQCPFTLDDLLAE